MSQFTPKKKFQDDIEMKLPEIRQTIFIVDPNRRYVFDVNQNITIKKLKSMIVHAAGLNRLGLRIFHDGIEYTSYDDYALDQLFPDLKQVEFYLQYSYEQIEDLEEIIDLKLKQHCPEHNDKYQYFYCFTCGKSFCCNCLKSGEHNGHNTKEKYDYLQGSKNLVEILFKDLKDKLKNAKGLNEDSIDQLKAKVSIQFFPKLIEMVKQIEQKMINLIYLFLDKDKGNLKTIENNINLLKNHCEEGLDKLKKEIVIEDMMIDENVFLTFHSKFQEIGKENDRFKDDILKYQQFSDNLAMIQNIIEKTYKEIYDFLSKYLDVTEFKDIKNKINAENISVIDKNRIQNILLSDLKKRKPLDVNNVGNNYFLRSRNVPIKEFTNEDIHNNISKKPNYQKDNQGKDNNILFKNDNFNNNMNNNEPFGFNNNIGLNNNFTNKNNGNVISFGVEDNLHDLDKNKDNFKLKGKTIIPNKSLFDNNINNNLFSNINDSGNMNNNFIDNNSKNNILLSKNNISNKVNLSEIKDSKKTETENEDNESNSPVNNVVCNIIPPEKQVVLYNVDLDTIIRKNVEFSPLIGMSHFFSECAWVNSNNKLYILGGVDDFSKKSNIFLEYDPIKEVIRRLPNSNYPHSSHSLFAYNNQIFAVGGSNLECEKFDIIKNEWVILPSLSFKQIYPVLYVHNDILYSFFGMDENIRKSDNVQKLNLKNNKSKWTKVLYKRNDCNLCVYGCGIAKINDNCILFLGGMDDQVGVRQDAIQFNFSNMTATKTDYMIEEKAYFKDSILLKLSPKDYGNFSIEEANPFLKIKFHSSFKSS